MEGGGPPDGAAACEAILFEVPDDGAIDVALDETHAYWVTRDGRVFRGSLQDETQTLLVAGPSGARFIAADADRVYVVTDTDLSRVHKTGGEREVLATGPFFPVGLAVVEDTVLVLDMGEDGALGVPPTRGKLHEWREESGARIVLETPGGLGSLVADERDVYFVRDEATSTSVIEPMLVRIHRPTGAVREIALPPGTKALGLRSDLVYITGGLAIGAMSRAGEDRVELVSGYEPGGDRVVRLAVDAEHAYFSSFVRNYNYGLVCDESVFEHASFSDSQRRTYTLDIKGSLSRPALTATHVAWTHRRDDCGPDQPAYVVVLNRAAVDAPERCPADAGH